MRRFPAAPATFPRMPHLDALVDLLRSRPAVVLSGAGCSTDSGIPDYGGLASRRRSATVQYRQFVGDPRVRARYWARSTVGWRRVADAAPNAAHSALAELEACGAVCGVITQNVDGLHQRAGSRRVVELHGSLARVRCLGCDAVVSRAGLQERLLAANPTLSGRWIPAAPDGDADLGDDLAAASSIPECETCRGMLKPDVVFFGECVAKTRLAEAWVVFDQGAALLVVGSSLAVYSGFRFVLRAVERGIPVVIVNLGPTRGDEHATLKVDEPVGAVLPTLSLGLAKPGAMSRSA